MRAFLGFCAISAIMATLPSPAQSQSAPAKLVVVWHSGDIAMTDYPSLARCNKGRDAILAETAQMRRESHASLRPGETIIREATYRVFCIPG